MSDRRRIILHIGLPKTGTSTIQRVLHTNREFLLGHEGVLYPSLAHNLSGALGTIFRDDPRKQWTNIVARLTTEEIAARRENYLNSLDAEISSSEWDTLLLSGEGICNLSTVEIARLREWGEKYSSQWTVLVCVRHPVDWTRSVIQQLLKRGNTLRQLYGKPSMPNFRARISRAISVFGQENVRVFDYESATEGEGGVVGAFARQAGLGTSSAELLASRAARRYNESLSMEAALILDALNRQRPMLVDNARGPHRSKLAHELAYLRRVKGRKFDVPDAVKENIRAHSREDVLWLNETFALDLYPDVAGFEPRTHGPREPAVEVPSYRATDSIAEVFGELVAESTFHRLLEQGRAASKRGNLERAAKSFREAARLDPDAPQPKRLLEQATAKQSGRSSEAPARRPKP